MMLLYQLCWEKGAESKTMLVGEQHVDAACDYALAFVNRNTGEATFTPAKVYSMRAAHVDDDIFDELL